MNWSESGGIMYNKVKMSDWVLITMSTHNNMMCLHLALMISALINILIRSGWSGCEMY